MLLKSDDAYNTRFTNRVTRKIGPYEKVIIICHSISVGAGPTELESDWSRAGPRLNLLFFAYSQE